jgi:hypothetical protein
MQAAYSDPRPANRSRRIFLVLIALVLGACRLFAPQAEPPGQEPPPASATFAAAPTLEQAAASPTAVLPSPLPPTLPPTLPPAQVLPTQPPLKPTAAPALPTRPPPTPTHPETLRLQMFMIAVGDNGQSGPALGCGDSAIPVAIDVPYTQGVLRAALERLLAHKSQYYGESGLYNALYQSSLQIDDLNITNGEAVIQLGGQVMLGGECDTPRLIAQLEQTALQFSTVQRVSIFLNGKPIREALSQR